MGRQVKTGKEGRFGYTGMVLLRVFFSFLILICCCLCVTDPPRLAASPGAKKVAEGEQVIFTCGADGNPKPDVKFLINGEVVESEY